MKLLAILLLFCALSGCNSANQSQEAIREAVIESVKDKVNVGAMDVVVTSISFKGEEADASVSFRVKGGAPESGMAYHYTLEQKSGKWVVKERSPEGAPHGTMPGGSQMPPGHPSVPPAEEKK